MIEDRCANNAAPNNNNTSGIFHSAILGVYSRSP
jgi:hypothetical protein